MIYLPPQLEAVVEQTGYKTLKSLMFLYHLVRNVNPDYVLELGTGYGCSAIFMALANNTTEIISVDDYKHDFISNDIFNVTKNLEKCNVRDMVNLIEGDTKEILLSISTKGIEIVFMDASHNEKDLQCEYNAFECLLSNNHIIVIDDVFAVNEYSESGGTTFGFVSKLAVKYESCTIIPFHCGMAILSTSINKYLNNITNAIREANHA